MSTPAVTTQTTEIVGTVAGGVLWGLARIYVATFSPVPPRKRDIAAAVVESTFAMISALIGGYFVSPWVVSALHAKTPETIGLLSVLTGLGFWQAIPTLRALAAHFLPDRIATLLGVKPPPEAQQ